MLFVLGKHKVNLHNTIDEQKIHEVFEKYAALTVKMTKIFLRLLVTSFAPSNARLVPDSFRSLLLASWLLTRLVTV